MSVGAALLHPVPIAAIGVLLVNDHWAKATFDNAITGKISDVAGLVFFPLLLQSLVEISAPRPSRRVLLGCIVATAVVFALVKTWAPAGEVYRWGLGLLQAPIRGAIRPVMLVRDATDLLALPALAIAWWVGRRRSAVEHV